MPSLTPPRAGAAQRAFDLMVPFCGWGGYAPDPIAPKYFVLHNTVHTGSSTLANAIQTVLRYNVTRASVNTVPTKPRNAALLPGIPNSTRTGKQFLQAGLNVFKLQLLAPSDINGLNGASF